MVMNGLMLPSMFEFIMIFTILPATCRAALPQLTLLNCCLDLLVQALKINTENQTLNLLIITK